MSQYTELSEATTKVMGALDDLAHVYDEVDPVGNAFREIFEKLDAQQAEAEAELARLDEARLADYRAGMREGV